MRLPPERLALGLVWTIAVVFVLVSHRDYGATWDEGLQARYGELSLQYFRSGAQDLRAVAYEDLYLYGPLFEMVPSLAAPTTGSQKFERRHLFLGLLATLTVPGVWLYARRFSQGWATIVAPAIVATLPRFQGHWFNNSKDLPFAVGILWFMAALLHLVEEERVRWTGVLGCGLAMGVAACARPGGLPLMVAFLGVGMLLRLGSGRGVELRILTWALPILILVPWALMVTPWPWAHASPIINPLTSMRAAADFETVVPVLFEGSNIQSDQLPWYYPWKSLAITTPLAVLALAGVGLITGVVEFARTRRSPALPLAALWLLLPLVLFTILRPNVYGGIRHFLFTLPALGILAAGGILWLLRRSPGRLRPFATVGLLALALSGAVSVQRLHPYPSTYYNATVGGVAGAESRYLTDYWLASYGEAIRWLNDRALQEGPLRVVIAASPPVMLWASEYASPEVELLPLRSLEKRRSLPGNTSYYLATTRNGLNLRFPEAALVHRVGRAGATFSEIRRGPRSSAP